MKERTAADLAPKSFAPRNPDGNDTPRKFPHLADYLILIPEDRNARADHLAVTLAPRIKWLPDMDSNHD